MTKKKQEELYDDSWLYILLLTTLSILLESLETYKFQLMGVSISYAIILLPIVYLLVNYITKKYDYKKAVAAISISAVISVCFMAIVSFALGKSLILTSLTGEFCGYVVSQFVNLTIYNFLLNNTKSPTLLILFNYLFSVIIFILLYTLINLGNMNLDSFWTKYFLMVCISFGMSIPMAFIDKRIKRGRDI